MGASRYPFALTISLTAIGQHAQRLGIRLLIEPTPSDANLVETLDDAKELRAQSGLDNVDLMFDVAHALFRAEQPEDYVRLYGADIRHIHLSDYNRMAPGDSGYDFTEMMQALKDISFDGYLTMEAAFTKRSEQPFTAARRAIEYLRGIEATLR